MFTGLWVSTAALRMAATDVTTITDKEKSLIEGLFRSELDALTNAKIPLEQGYPSKKLVNEVSKIIKIACEKRLVSLSLVQMNGIYAFLLL